MISLHVFRLASLNTTSDQGLQYLPLCPAVFLPNDLVGWAQFSSLSSLHRSFNMRNYSPICVPGEDLDQPAYAYNHLCYYLLSLINFCCLSVEVLESWLPTEHPAMADRLHGCAGCHEFAGQVHHKVYFLMFQLVYHKSNRDICGQSHKWFKLYFNCFRCNIMYNNTIFFLIWL